MLLQSTPLLPMMTLDPRTLAAHNDLVDKDFFATAITVHDDSFATIKLQESKSLSQSSLYNEVPELKLVALGVPIPRFYSLSSSEPHYPRA
ncbi:hypothetical protein ACH5RR_021805 [Cinchona calisaya]|uniref:Uncharacterized protein n=1 Tax=Cinchona calisaya TaxID=153742 RepID=A0ABD2ZIB4_9GENT